MINILALNDINEKVHENVALSIATDIKCIHKTADVFIPSVRSRMDLTLIKRTFWGSKCYFNVYFVRNYKPKKKTEFKVVAF